MSDELEALRRRVLELETELMIERATANRAGVERAIRWIDELPRLELVVGRVRIGEEVLRRCARMIARRLRERLDASDRPTLPAPLDD